MKKFYQIWSMSFMVIRIEGGILQRCETTGQVSIYKGNNPVYTEILAIIPKDLMVIVE